MPALFVVASLVGTLLIAGVGNVGKVGDLQQNRGMVPAEAGL